MDGVDTTGGMYGDGKWWCRFVTYSTDAMLDLHHQYNPVATLLIYSTEDS